MAKDGLPEVAKRIADCLVTEGFDLEYDDAGTIGRRYARADEVGVPISITIDYQTVKDETVTLRDRDTWQQVRIEWKAIPQLLHKFLRGEVPFSALGIPVKVAYE
jgi:glycyl-tRNA synthetase